MAVGIRSLSSTGSYGSTQNSLRASAFQPDFFGGRQGTMYVDYRAIDEANGYDFDRNGRALGSGKNGYETRAERAERMGKREKVVRDFTNSLRGSGNMKQYKDNNQASYDKAYREAYDRARARGQSPSRARRTASVTARRVVNQREQARLRRVAEKTGMKFAESTQR